MFTSIGVSAYNTALVTSSPARSSATSARISASQTRKMSRTNRRVSRTARGAGSRRATNERIMDSQFGCVRAGRILFVAEGRLFVPDLDDAAELNAREHAAEQP